MYQIKAFVAKLTSDANDLGGDPAADQPLCPPCVHPDPRRAPLAGDDLASNFNQQKTICAELATWAENTGCQVRAPLSPCPAGPCPPYPHASVHRHAYPCPYASVRPCLVPLLGTPAR